MPIHMLIHNLKPIVSLACRVVCQVPEMRGRLLARSDWAELAARQAAGPLGPGLAQLSQARAASLLRSFRFMCELEPDAAPPGPQACTSGLFWESSSRFVERSGLVGVLWHA